MNDGRDLINKNFFEGIASQISPMPIPPNLPKIDSKQVAREIALIEKEDTENLLRFIDQCESRVVILEKVVLSIVPKSYCYIQNTPTTTAGHTSEQDDRLCECRHTK